MIAYLDLGAGIWNFTRNFNSSSSKFSVCQDNETIWYIEINGFYEVKDKVNEVRSEETNKFIGCPNRDASNIRVL